MARTKGAVATHNNIDTKEILMDLEIFNYGDVPRWLDDVVSGSCGQVPGTQKFSPAALYSIISTLDIISSETVGALLNRKREALGDAPVSVRYAQYVAKAARCASEAVQYHMYHGKI